MVDKKINQFLLLITIVVLSALTFAVIADTNIIFSFSVVVISYVLIAQACQTAYTKAQFVVFVVTFSVMLIILPLQASLNFIPLSGTDWIGFERHVDDIISLNVFEAFSSNKTLYVKIITGLYYFFGRNRCLIYFLSYWSFLGSIITVNKTLRLVNCDHSSSSKALYLVALSPIEIVFALSYLREMPMQLLSIIILNRCIKYRVFKKSIFLVEAFLACIVASMLHSALLATIVLIFGTLLCNEDDKNFRTKRLIILFVFIVTLLSTNVLSMMTEKFGDISTDSISNKMSYSNGNTTYVYSEINGPVDLIIQLPYRIVMFTFAPFPWQIRNIGSLISFFLASLPQYYHVYFLFSYIKKRGNKNNKYIMYIIISLAVLYIICSVGTNNYGTAIRHRVKMYPVACFLLGLILSLENEHDKENKSIC
ncbi:MAG: hypothetical protein WBK46_05980 [Ruminococcus flavefaciens]